MKYILSEPGTETEFELYLDLRWRLLRKPWGQPKDSAYDAGDPQAYHILAKTPDEEAVGIGRIHPESQESWQIRYMAVAPLFQKQGLGRAILKKLEAYAIENKAGEIFLHAREEAKTFYQCCGYKFIEESHQLFGIQHYKMLKMVLE